MFFRKKIQWIFRFSAEFQFFCRFLGWLSKRRPSAQMRVLRENDFFLEKKCFWFFFGSWAENCHTLAMNLQPIVKNAFGLSRGIFFKEIVSFLKDFLTVWHFLSEIERNLLKKLKKMDFWPEKTSTFVIAGFHASKELFVDFFLGKRSVAKTFSQLERNFVKFCRNFSADSWKAHHCVHMNLLSENMFLIMEK